MLPECNLEYFKKSGHEKQIKIDDKTYYLDCFIPELNLAIEFNGDIWHGNPKIYKPEDICDPFEHKITAAERQMIDKIKIDDLKSAGIKTIVVWESEYDSKKFDLLKLINKIKNNN